MIFKSTGDGSSKEMVFECDDGGAAYGPWVVAAGHKNHPTAQMDWFLNWLQILIQTEDDDEPKIYVRFKPDGSFAEIVIAPELMKLVRSSGCIASRWENERDEHEESKLQQKGEIA